MQRYSVQGRIATVRALMGTGLFLLCLLVLLLTGVVGEPPALAADSEPGVLAVTPPVRVNAGGPAYTDSSGLLWSADQAYTAGSWGYVGGSSVYVGHPISNTADSPLYYTIRLAPSGYKFDLASGNYDVELRFAEVLRNQPGIRRFDVRIEGTRVITDLDVYALAGHDRALDFLIRNVSVSDSQLNIDFTPITDTVLISALVVSPTLANLTPSPAPPPVTPTAAWRYTSPTDRFAVSVVRRPIDNYDIRLLRLGLYLDFTFRTSPPRPYGVQFVQMVRVCVFYPPDWNGLAAAIAANRGALWLIGNEPEASRQDQCTPAEYAQHYHELYQFIKSRDSSARIAAGNVVEPTPLRLQWLDVVLAEYHTRYGEKMPVDAWVTHNQILPEGGSWGAGIPVGLGATGGQRYTINDNDSLPIFISHMVAFCRWLRNNGYQQQPVYLTEYGALMPPMYGFTPERVNSFMLNTFDYMMHATDPGIGNPLDDDRLVQGWYWYSMDDDVYFNGPLFSRTAPYPGVLTPMGVAYSGYTALLGSVSVNFSQTSTHQSTVAVTLGATQYPSTPLVSEYQLNNTGRFVGAGGPWYSLTSNPLTVTWNLDTVPANSYVTRTVYARFRNVEGRISQVYSDTIRVDTAPPVVIPGAFAINGGASYSLSPNVYLSLGATDQGSGLAQMRLTGDVVSPTGWIPYQPTLAGVTLTEGNGPKTVFVEYRDVAGNVTGPISTTITLDSAASGVDVAAAFGLQGRPDPPSPRYAIPLTVTLHWPGVSTPLLSQVATGSSDGVITLTHLNPGLYDIRLKGRHSLWLRRNSVPLLGSTNAITVGMIREGDTDGDEAVTILDVSRISANYGRRQDTPGFDPQADLNDDTAVDILDVSLVSSNYGRSGDVQALSGHEAGAWGEAWEKEPANAPSDDEADRLVTQPTLPPVLPAVPEPQTTPLPLSIVPQANAVLRFSPTSRVVAVNGAFNMDVYLDLSGNIADSVALYINFNAALLSVVSVSNSGVFPTVVNNTFDNTAGTIDFAATKLGGTVSGNGVKVATISFRAKSTSGTTVLTFNNSGSRITRVAYSGASLPLTLNQATIQIAVPQPTSTPTITPTPTVTPTPTPLVATLCVQVYHDRNNDQMRQSGEEELLAGATITVRTPASQTVAALITTGAEDQCFAPLLVGNYFVTETNPPGYVSTTPDDWGVLLGTPGTFLLAFGDRPGAATTATPTPSFTATPTWTPIPSPTITTTPSVTPTPTPATSQLCARVYHDRNQDATYQPESEELLPGAVLTLYRGGIQLYRETTTLSNQPICFPRLLPGLYRLVETNPAGFSSTTPDDLWAFLGASGDLLIDFGDRLVPTMTPTPTPVMTATPTPTLTPTLTWTASATATPTPTATFTPTPTMTPTATPSPTATWTATPTFTPTPTTGTICVLAFVDLNRDAVWDRPGEPLLAGATIILSKDRQEVRRRYTDGHGEPYCFSNLLPGQYEVYEEDPPGYTSTAPNLWVVYLAANRVLTVAFGDYSLSAALFPSWL